MTRMDSDGNGSLSQEEFVQGVLKVTASFPPVLPVIFGCLAIHPSISPYSPSQGLHQFPPNKDSQKEPHRVDLLKIARQYHC